MTCVTLREPTVAARQASDSELMRGVRERDRQAFECLFRRYSRLVRGIAGRVLRDPSKAEDAAQDVFERLWRRPAGYDESRARFAPWLS